MDHPYAKVSLGTRIVQEVRNHSPRLAGEQAMEVEFLLNPVLATLQVSEHTPAQARAHKPQFISRLQIRCVDGVAEEVLENGTIILTPVARACGGGRCTHVGLVMFEAADLTDCAKKMADIVRIAV